MECLCFTLVISLIITDWLVFIIEIQCVFCEVGTVFKGTEWQQLYCLRDHPASYSVFTYWSMLFLWDIARKVCCLYWSPILNITVKAMCCDICVTIYIYVHGVMCRCKGAPVFYVVRKPPYVWRGGDKHTATIFQQVSSLKVEIQGNFEAASSLHG